MSEYALAHSVDRVRKEPYSKSSQAREAVSPAAIAASAISWKEPDLSTVRTTYAAAYGITVTQALNLPYTWDADEVKDAMAKMRAAGMDVNTFDDLVKSWGGLVDRAATTLAMSKGEKKLTPWDVLDLYKKEAEDSGLLDKLNGSRTTVSRSVEDVDEGQAWATLKSATSELLGYDPSDQDVRDFTYKMGQLAARNPNITKTITSYQNGEATGQTSHTTPGFTAADMEKAAYDEALNDPGHAEYASASTYFNAAISALGPIGG